MAERQADRPTRGRLGKLYGRIEGPRGRDRAGVHSPGVADDRWYYLRNHASVFQAEVYAVTVGLKKILRPMPMGRKLSYARTVRL